MNKKYNWLELVEFFSIGSFFLGVITTAITKQILFFLIPLSFALLFNIINRQRDNIKMLEQSKYTKELYDNLSTLRNDYKLQKLEIRQLMEQLNKQKLELENKQKLELENKQKLELENKNNQYYTNTNKNYLLTSVNNSQDNIKPSKSEIYNQVSSGLKPFSQNNKWGYKDSNGNIVIQPIFDYAWDFFGEFAKVKKESWGNYKYGLINFQGDIVLPIEYYSIEPFCEGMARITQESWGNYRYGFINDQGNLVIPIKYDYAESFSNGLAKVKKNNHSFYIDKKGNKV